MAETVASGDTEMDFFGQAFFQNLALGYTDKVPGPAGLAAGIYAKRAGLECVVLENGVPGGQVLTSPNIEKTYLTLTTLLRARSDRYFSGITAEKLRPQMV